MPLETGEEVATIAAVPDEVPQDKGLEAQIQEPIEGKSWGKEVALVADREATNDNSTSCASPTKKCSGGWRVSHFYLCK